jgi:hypothetical protein
LDADPANTAVRNPAALLRVHCIRCGRTARSVTPMPCGSTALMRRGKRQDNDSWMRIVTIAQDDMRKTAVGRLREVIKGGRGQDNSRTSGITSRTQCNAAFRLHRTGILRAVDRSKYAASPITSRRPDY